MEWRLRYRPIQVSPTKTTRPWVTITEERPELVFQPLFQTGVHHIAAEVVVTTSLRTQTHTREESQPSQEVTSFRDHPPFQMGAHHYHIPSLGSYRTPTPLVGYHMMLPGLHNTFTPHVFGTRPGPASHTKGEETAPLPDLRDKLRGKFTSALSLQSCTNTSMCPSDPSAPTLSETSPMDSQEDFNPRASPSPNRMDAHSQHSSSFNGTHGSAQATTWTNWIPTATTGSTQPNQGPTMTETGNLRFSALTGPIAPGLGGTGHYPGHPFHWGNGMATTMPHQFAFLPPISTRIDNQGQPDPGHESSMFCPFV